jgi:phage shock protein A
MLEEIRRVLRRSVDAFREELSRRDPEDQVAELLSAMRRELVAARAAIPEIEAHLAGAREELDRERAALAQCERRGELAVRIGDAETRRIAGEFAARHRERVAVLTRKVEAAEADLELHHREVEEMLRRYREAEANRFALAAQLRRARPESDRRAATSEELESDFDRMRDRVERAAAHADALEELDGPLPPPSSDPSALEERLRELKRRMGQE